MSDERSFGIVLLALILFALYWLSKNGLLHVSTTAGTGVNSSSFPSQPATKGCGCPS